LLDLSRLDAGAVKPQWGEHDVAALLRQLHEEFAGVARERGLAFVLDIERAAGPYMAHTDADQLQRILRNLLDNAFKFTEAGQVRLALVVQHLRGGTRQLRITVADTGCGIPRGERERVFEEFHQLGNPARERIRGLGLGLAIVQRTAALLGARVRIADAEETVDAAETAETAEKVDAPDAPDASDAKHRPGGPGTRFEVTLPALVHPATAATTVSAVPASAAAAPAEAAVEHLAVLLVDDEADIVQAQVSLLHALRWTTHTANDAGSALALAADSARRIDIAVVDHRLPGGHGIELIRGLRALRPELPALMVTGDVAVQWEVLRHGVNVLHKPLGGETLVAAITAEVAAAHRWAQRLDVFAPRSAEGPEPAMNLIDAIHGRRSVRSFEPTPVPREVLEDLLWHAVQVPMPPVSDEHSWAVVVVEGRERLATCAERARRFAIEHPPSGRPWG